MESAHSTSSGPVGVGSSWTSVRRVGRRQVSAPIEVVDYESDRRLAIVSESGPIRVHAAMSFAPASTGTDVTEVLEMRVGLAAPADRAADEADHDRADGSGARGIQARPRGPHSRLAELMKEPHHECEPLRADSMVPEADRTRGISGMSDDERRLIDITPTRRHTGGARLHEAGAGRRRSVGVLVAVGACVLVLAACGGGPTVQPAATTPSAAATQSAAASESAASDALTVTLRASQFSPRTLTVPVGAKVTFINVDAMEYSATNGNKGIKAENALFDLDLKPGTSGSFTFGKAGTYSVTCLFDPRQQMNMTITVQ